jgi:hypothetical protein
VIAVGFAIFAAVASGAFVQRLLMRPFTYPASVLLCPSCIAGDPVNCDVYGCVGPTRPEAPDLLPEGAVP